MLFNTLFVLHSADLDNSNNKKVTALDYSLFGLCLRNFRERVISEG